MTGTVFEKKMNEFSKYSAVFIVLRIISFLELLFLDYFKVIKLCKLINFYNIFGSVFKMRLTKTLKKKKSLNLKIYCQLKDLSQETAFHINLILSKYFNFIFINYEM